MKKEKPTYSTWQNTAFVLGMAWKNDKIVPLTIVAEIIMAVAIATLGIFLPAVVVEQITSGAYVQVLITTVLGFTLVLTILNALSTYVESTLRVRRTGMRMIFTNRIVDKILTTDYANLEKKEFNDAKSKAGENVSSNSVSTEQIYYTFTNLGTNMLGFVVYIVLLAAVNPFVLVITAATAVFGAVARQLAIRWRHNNDDLVAQPDKRIRYIQFLGERTGGIAKDIRLFGMLDWVRDVYEEAQRLRFHFHKRVQMRNFAADAVTAIATFAREGIAYAYLIWLVLGGEIGVDGFVLMFAAVGGFSGWISGILTELAQLSQHSLDICRVREFLEFPDEFKREGNPFKEDTYELQLNNVSFRYNGAEKNTLENINLTIKPGEKLAIVGVNGAGKTTLVKLLCGFYDPTEGEVLLNGKDIRSFNRIEYYKLFTAVFQEFNILATSIAQNITSLETGHDRNKINECLKLADLDKKINSLPNGIDSLLIKDVHLDAVEFSGGETQRLMLARALYKNAPILILDEPTAALDPIAESNLYEKYNELSHGRTSVYISHRLASTRFCDRIIMVDDKGLSETGTHDELIQLGGKYAEMYEIQSKYYKEGEAQ